MKADQIHKRQLKVSFHNTGGAASGIGAIAAQLSNAEKQTLSHAPWQDKYPCKPEVLFSMTYDHDHFYLQFEVRECHLRATHGKINDPVYQDSCVEFFVSFDNGVSYYNFEFNCIGTVLAAFGSTKASRVFLPEDVLEQIACQSIIRKEAPFVYWQLTVAIPFDAFLFHTLSSLQGQQCRANFYKCGDRLPAPHFLCWSDVRSHEPDFHLPAFFGTLVFV